MLNRYPLLSLMAECDGTENLTALQTVMVAAELTSEKASSPNPNDADVPVGERRSSGLSSSAEGRPVETLKAAAVCDITTTTTKTASTAAAVAEADVITAAPASAPSRSEGGTTKTPENPDMTRQLDEVKTDKQDRKIVPRLSSADRLRIKTYRVQKDLQDLIVRHSNRHVRLQNIKDRQSVVAGMVSCGGSLRRSQDGSPSRMFRQLSVRKTNGPQLPDLRKCFEESRAKYLMDAERKKKSLPPLYSSRIPRPSETLIKEKGRNIMKDTGSFGLRFFNSASLQEPRSQNNTM